MTEAMNGLKKEVDALLDSFSGHYSIAIEHNDVGVNWQADHPCEAASLIKIPILMEALRQADLGCVDLEQQFHISNEERVGGSGVISYLSAPYWTLKDLLTLMMIVSDNTATNQVIDLLGMDAINTLCLDIGCADTVLQRRLFNQEAMQEGKTNVTSARDMLCCLKQIAEGPLLSYESRQLAWSILKAQQLANKLPAKVVCYDDNDPIIAHKTGEIHGVEHDVGMILHHSKKAYVAVLLTGLHQNGEGRHVIAEIGERIIKMLSH
ncbi:serine hydrolase [Pullulanibacillus camelliae]|uniref:Serine hydrolase n=1 Tax=Pullulanibacillus camelliae TaxID=1707096 RepID=A0A8J2VN49_9BACL|nr:serine hydrolase [Pullulanibacillus camelliae]GGE32078.1 serine hydrolase [Pullulanibacillus camelliae]